EDDQAQKAELPVVELHGFRIEVVELVPSAHVDARARKIAPQGGCGRRGGARGIERQHDQVRASAVEELLRRRERYLDRARVVLLREALEDADHLELESVHRTFGRVHQKRDLVAWRDLQRLGYPFADERAE